MKRDLDLVRAILKDVENAPAGKTIIQPTLEGYGDKDIGEHVWLLADAGLIDAEVTRTMRGPYTILIRRLTWRGHDFIDAAKNDSVWNQVKGKILKHVGGVTFDVLLELLKAETRLKLGLPS